MPHKPHKPSAARVGQRPDDGPATVRIIGGEFRGRKLRYVGDERTRPMKDRVREAVFNLLTNSVRGTHAIDLFAGTGALGLEALSRGATSATLVERHIPTAKVIRENAQMLGAERRANVVGGDAFYWAGRLPSPTNIPWIVFVSPPFELYVTACSEMLELIGKMLDSAPPGSTLVVESDDRFDHQGLPQPEAWDVRSYPPAVVAIYRK